METLTDFLINRGYSKVKLKLTKTNHFEIKASINGVNGRFILDTGASSSCVGFEAIERFNLKVKDSEIRAVGAGASDMLTQISSSNDLKIGKWKKRRVALILFNLSHVNNGLVNHNADPVDGIIGADILKKGKAIIDYEKKYLYLRMKDISKPKDS
ncbi:retropepsin-like aspartic protease family protein [Winogradskyella flava]|uniref:Clan AA aspartic protease n=1 Tax=Winogradskyella flava TaxID=1884876 RepID=A0A842IJY4_9FLAO|nr:retropepsin-like aspartic protease [Winogradskyella flava]MBC2843602.1 clan AA aspartic protease [Winogradskyella flava]